MDWYRKAIKGYVPLARLNKQDIINSVYEDTYASRSDAFEYYEQMVKDRLGEDVDEAILKTEVKEMVFEALDDSYEERLWRMKDWSKRFPVWRAIRVKDGGTPEMTFRNVRINSVGIYWSYDEGSIACHLGDYSAGTVQVNLKARITPGVVDWPASMILQLSDLGEDEKEVRLIEGSRILITEMTVCYGERRDGHTKVKVNLEATA
jgi:hypothetical protein